jgi:lysophospholipase L1-like esterase
VLYALAACSTDPATGPAVAPSDILFLGNSITVHGPDASIGWGGSWGMAASDSARDYAHLLARRFPGARHTEVHIADFERDYRHYDLHALDFALDQRPDLVVVEVGDNVTDTTDIAPYYARLVAYVAASSSGPVLCVSTWWNSRPLNAAIRAGCVAPRARYVDVSALWANVADRASSERTFADPFVGDHPGDLGMARIADALYAALTTPARP